MTPLFNASTIRRISSVDSVDTRPDTSQKRAGDPVPEIPQTTRPCTAQAEGNHPDRLQALDR